MKQVHATDCEKKPADCCCENVSWIWAKSPIQLESVRCGKWILYPDKQDVNEIWEIIKSLLGENKLCNKAKVSTSSFLDTHLICVYTNNSDDVSEVFRIFNTLQRSNLNYTYVTRYSRKIEVQGVEEATVSQLVEQTELKKDVGDSVEVEEATGSQLAEQTELKKDVGDSEVRIDILNNLPGVNITFNLNQSPCQQPDCNKQSLLDSNENVSWIWAKSPVQLNSVRSGQWILYSDKQDVNEHWKKIKTLLSQNILGNCARVSNREFLGTHIICVYTNDYQDVQDVFRVLVELRRSHQNNYVMHYTRPSGQIRKEQRKEGIVNIAHLYKSPSLISYNLTVDADKILMIRQRTKILAEVRKFPGDIESTTTFYNPPKILNLFADGRRQFGLIKINENPHKPDCKKQPLNCKCEDISWIHENLPGAVKSVRSGKWMIFADKRNANEIWEKVKMLLFSYQLGYFAKVQTGNIDGKHLICVYTQDYEDVRDVFRVLVTLRRNGLQYNNFFYKTCEASSKGVYKTDEVAQKYGFPAAKKLESGEKVSMYHSPAIAVVKADTEIIQLILNNIGPEYQSGLVAESRKESGESEAIEVFYNPPQILNNFIQNPTDQQQLVLLPLLPCKYDDLIVKALGRDSNRDEKFHEDKCNQQPSTCQCADVFWISASLPALLNPNSTGKWMLFPDKKHVDKNWEKLKILLAAKRLGPRIKVSTNEFLGKYLICVYTNDYENIRDVFRVLVTLRRNFSFGYLNYKTNEATHQKIYGKETMAQMNDRDSAKELESGQKVSMYHSPPNLTTNDPTGTNNGNELIQLYLNNIGPKYKTSLVAHLRKKSFRSNTKLKFFLPQTLNSTFESKRPRVSRRTIALFKPVFP